jgi:hypothetical protein
MKRILFCVVFLVGCDTNPKATESGVYGLTGTESAEIRTVKDDRSNTHEYMFYSRGHGASMTHYPDCKFCKEKSR